MSDRAIKGHWPDSGTSEPELARYAPHFSARCRLITCHTRGREPVLASEAAVHLWQTLLLAVRRDVPYRLHGYVTLPDHVHLLLETPDGTPPDAIVQNATRRFERDYQVMMGLPDGAPIWPLRQRIDRLDDLPVFAAALDYIHYNPVRHGLVMRPEDWPHSSYNAWMERRLYKLGWGWHQPERLTARQWE